MIIPRQKVKVFISSICGVDKYDELRAKLKQLIEETNLADVYLFEATGASTLTTQQHYVWDLENSDICIFIIDNADGVKSGVQKEIDAAKNTTKNRFSIFVMRIVRNQRQSKKD